MDNQVVYFPRQEIWNLVDGDTVWYRSCVEFLHTTLMAVGIELKLSDVPGCWYECGGRVSTERSEKYSSSLTFLLKEFVRNTK